MAPTPSGTKRADSPPWLKVAGLSSPLTAAEQRVLAALADGSVADVHSGGARQPIRAGLIRAIAFGLALPVEQIDPRGLHVVGALISERIELDDVSFARPLRLIDCELEAGLSAERAELHLLELEGCTIGAPDSAKAGGSDGVAALMLDGMQVAHEVSFAWSEVTGAVRLVGASIGGQLDFYDGTFTNDTGPALFADGLTTTSDVFLNGTFTGHSQLGAVRLLGATIGSQLHCTGGTFTNKTGPALLADGLTTTSNVLLGGTFTGHSERGTVRLLGASIGSQLHCTGGSLRSMTSGALQLQGTRVHDAWILDPAFRSTDTPGTWLNLDGLTYAGTPHGWGAARQFGALDWARLLSGQTERYAAQPYQHLAGAYRAAGHEQDAKAVLIAQQDDRRQRVVKAEGHRWHAFVMLLSKIFTGYGYQSSRALWWLVGLAAVSIALAALAGNVAIDVNANPANPSQWTTVLAHKPTKTDAGTPCSPVELVGVGMGWAVPIVDTKASARCLLNTTHPYGQWWTATSWVFHVLGWAFATLAVAGYTGLIRKL